MTFAATAKTARQAAVLWTGKRVKGAANPWHCGARSVRLDKLRAIFMSTPVLVTRDPMLVNSLQTAMEDAASKNGTLFHSAKQNVLNHNTTELFLFVNLTPFELFQQYNFTF